MRFHGRSAAPEDSAFDLAEAAADVRALLDHLKIQAGDTAAKGIPGARKIVYPDAGHMINMEQPDTFNRDLAAFLGQGR